MDRGFTKFFFAMAFAIAVFFLMPISAKAETTGFPDYWSYDIRGNVIYLSGYHGESSTVIIEGPINYNGIEYEVRWTGSAYGASDCVKKLYTRGTVMGENFRLEVGRNITDLDLSHVHLDDTTDLSYMFYRLENLENLKLGSYLCTSSVTNLDYMFCECKKLKNLDLSGFDTSGVTSMHGMFEKCISLESINLSSFNTQNVTDMAEMFWGCLSLTSLDLSNFNTENAANMLEMFFSCSSLKSIELSSFNVRPDCNVSFMFHGCLALECLDLSGFDANGGEFGGFYSNSGLNSLRSMNTPRNVRSFELPAMFVKENGKWVAYSSIWEDSSGKRYDDFQINDNLSNIIEESFSLTYIGMSTRGYVQGDDFSPPKWYTGEGSSSGSNTSGSTSGSTLPNTDASDFRYYLMLTFLLSLTTFVIVFSMKKKMMS